MGENKIGREALEFFADVMCRRLWENWEKKGDSWRRLHLSNLLKGLFKEIEELNDALIRLDPDAIVLECADAANYLMFIADLIRRKNKLSFKPGGRVHVKDRGETDEDPDRKDQSGS